MYGDYWKQREGLSFNTSLNADVLTITIPDNMLPLDPKQSFVIEDGSTLTGVQVKSESGNPLSFQSTAWQGTDLLLYQQAHRTLTITAPNGGESWPAGSSQTISWTWQGAIDNVSLAFSTDNGATWTSISASIVNNGTYPWTVPGGTYDELRVRVEEVGGQAADMSNTVFSNN